MIAGKLHNNYFVMACYISITSAANTLKSITIGSGLGKYYGSKYYNAKEDAFRFILG